jgi:hypothetical protein
VILGFEKWLKNGLQLGKVTHTLIPTLEKLREEDHEFKANLGYITRHFQK